MASTLDSDLYVISEAAMKFPLIGGRRFVRIGLGYLGVAVLLTVLLLIARSVAPPTGLTRSFYVDLESGTAPLFEVETTSVDLAFIDEQSELPTRSHRVRWEGVWFSPHPEIVDFYAGSDDVVVLTVDGTEVLRRGPAVGMHTISQTVMLAEGAHRLSIDYQQWKGARALKVQWAPVGALPRPLSSIRLFPADPGKLGYWFGVAAFGLPFLVIFVWSTGLTATCVVLFGPWIWTGVVRWYQAVLAMTMRDVWRRLYTLGLPVLLLASVLFLVGAHTIYAWNIDEFSLPFHDIAAPWLIAVVASSWACLMAPGVFLSDRLLRLYAVVLFGLSLLFWAQGNLWVGNYGVLDGSDIDLGQLAWRVPYELGIWAVGLIVSVIFHQRIIRVAPFASLLFLGLQVAAIVVGQSAERRVQWSEPPLEVYQFSAKQNVIFVVLDEFQSDLFTELLEDDRGSLEEQFRGFVYFTDHAGTFPTTSVSIPAMLTGQAYRNDRPVPEFVNDAFEEASILQGLQQHHYEIDVVSILSPAWVDDWFPPDESGSGLPTVRMTIRKPYVGIDDYRKFTARQLIELSVFRHVPHTVKVLLDNRPDWFTKIFWAGNQDSVADERRHEAVSSQAFFSQFIDRITVDRAQPVFKLIHLGIPHRPVVVDATCAYLGQMRFSREGYLAQSRCAVGLVLRFLERLRALGIYDQSLIIVASDHGTDLEPRGFSGDINDRLFSGMRPSTPLIYGVNGTQSGTRLKRVVGMAKALMLVKPPRRSGPLTISKAPTTHTDLPSTVFELLGFPHSFVGQSMFEQDPTVPRRRTYGMYHARAERFPEGYLSRLDIFAIEGDVLDGTGWVYERSILDPDLKLTAATINLGDDDARPHLGPGWSRNVTEDVDGREASFVWGHGQAVVFVALPSDGSQLFVRLSAAEDRDKVVNVEIDGQLLGDQMLRGDTYQDVVWEIPADPDRPRISSLIFNFESVIEQAPGVKVDRVSVRSN